MLPGRRLRPAVFKSQKGINGFTILPKGLSKFSTISKNASSAARWRTLPYRPASTSSTYLPQLALKAGAIPSICASRFYSSNNASSTGQDASPQALQPPASDSALPSFSNYEAPDFAALLGEEGIGYLKSIGLDHGWGPTSVVQWSLEHIHIYTGLPWWASIALTGLAIRAILFPLYVGMADFTGKQAALGPVIAPLQKRQAEATKNGDAKAMSQAMAEIQQVYRDAGVLKGFKYMSAPILQGIFGFCAWRCLSNATTLPVPGFLNGGFLWLSDLTIADPFYILPLTTALFMHIVLRTGGETGAAAGGPMGQSPRMRLVMLYGLPLLSFVVVSWQAAGIQIYFFVTSISAQIQGIIFRQNWIRAKLGIVPIPKDPGRYMKKDTQSATVINTTATSRTSDYRYQAPKDTVTEKKKNVKFSALNPGTWGPSAGAKIQKMTGSKQTNPNSPEELRKKHIQRAEAYEERRKKELEREKQRGGR